MKQAAGLLALVFAGVQLLAQVTTGSLTGNVIDATGAVVPAATVTLISDATNEVHSAKTNANGSYAFVAMQPSRYTLQGGTARAQDRGTDKCECAGG
jgi:protocatechuate 3,4-dioxygenase beta subunit